MDIKHAMLRIKDHMEVHHMAESPRCKYITEALQMALNIMGAFEQVAWERLTHHDLYPEKVDNR